MTLSLGRYDRLTPQFVKSYLTPLVSMMKLIAAARFHYQSYSLIRNSTTRNLFAGSDREASKPVCSRPRPWPIFCISQLPCCSWGPNIFQSGCNSTAAHCALSTPWSASSEGRPGPAPLCSPTPSFAFHPLTGQPTCLLAPGVLL